MARRVSSFIRQSGGVIMEKNSGFLLVESLAIACEFACLLAQLFLPTPSLSEVNCLRSNYRYKFSKSSPIILSYSPSDVSDEHDWMNIS